MKRMDKKKTSRLKKKRREQDDEESTSEAARNDFDPAAPLAHKMKNPHESLLFASGESIRRAGTHSKKQGVLPW